MGLPLAQKISKSIKIRKKFEIEKKIEIEKQFFEAEKNFFENFCSIFLPLRPMNHFLILERAVTLARDMSDHVGHPTYDS